MIPIADDPPRRSFPWVTVTFILINVLVFVYELTLGPRQLDRFMQAVGVVPLEIVTGVDLPPPAVTPGIPYIALFTSMFVHGGFMHIIGNMLYLWVFGDNVEDSFGHMRFIAFYLTCGVLAGLAQVAVSPTSTVPSIGASGAVAGVLGAYLLIFPHAAVRTMLFIGPFITFPRISAVILIGFWFVPQLFSGLASLGVETEQTGGVAFWAHVGGFVAGLVIAMAFRPRSTSYSRPAW